jgi:hypothetical protein
MFAVAIDIRNGESEYSSREGSMKLIEYFNSRVKMLNIYDIRLIQGTVIFLTLIVVKLIPQLMNVDIRIYIVLLVLSLGRSRWQEQ